MEDRRRARDLRRMKLVSGGMLVVATIVYLLARSQEHRGGAWGYVRAAAEASMVGGIADWFAVTALFRHPFGIPIPHTAIIRKRKDERKIKKTLFFLRQLFSEITMLRLQC